MAGHIGSSARRRSTRVGLPQFTAPAALRPPTRQYASTGGGRADGPGVQLAQVTVSAVSGIYAGTVCVGGVQCVITVDVDEHGHVTGSHCVDEIGSC